MLLFFVVYKINIRLRPSDVILQVEYRVGIEICSFKFFLSKYTWKLIL